MVADAVWIEDAAHGWLPATAAEGRNESTVGITVAKTACKKRLSAVDVTSVPTKAVLVRALGDLQATVADMTQLTDVSEVCTAEARTASTHATHTAAASPGTRRIDGPASAADMQAHPPTMQAPCSARHALTTAWPRSLR